MRHNEASRTTQRPALLRAAHQLLDDDPKIHVDPLAVGLIPEASPESIRAEEKLIRSPEYTLLRSTFVLRARYAEDSLAAAALCGVSQYVILGAGLDTFAYRQPEYAQSMQIFEVDHPASQTWKRERLAAREISLPQNLRYVAVDFERDSLAQRLFENGFSTEHPTFFSWLGVVMFLTGPSIESTLGFIARLPRRSALTLSFIVPHECLVGEDLDLARYSVESCASRGEPWLSLHRPEELRAIVHRAGFSQAEHFAPDAATERYFHHRKDGLRAPRHEQLLTAWV